MGDDGHRRFYCRRVTRILGRMDAGEVLEKWLNTGLVIAITTVWTVSMIVDAFSDRYEVNPLVHGIMMTVATTVLGVQIIRKDRTVKNENGET